MTGSASRSADGLADELKMQGDGVEFRPDRAYRRPALRRFLLLAVVTALLALTPLPVAMRDAAWLTGAIAAWSGVTYLWRGRFATRVTSRGIEARGYLNHFVPWEDVAGLHIGGSAAADARPGDPRPQYVRAGLGGTTVVSKGPAGFGRLAAIRIVRANGHKLLLPAPVVTAAASDARFDDKARQLQELCRRYGRPPLTG
jgi:hypothetical protein